MNRRYGVVFLAVFLGLCSALFASRKPWNDLSTEKLNKADAVQELRKAEAQKAELIRLNSKYAKGPGWEELAREKGFHKPGERPLKELMPSSSK